MLLLAPSCLPFTKAVQEEECAATLTDEGTNGRRTRPDYVQLLAAGGSRNHTSEEFLFSRKEHPNLEKMTTDGGYGGRLSHYDHRCRQIDSDDATTCWLRLSVRPSDALQVVR